MIKLAPNFIILSILYLLFINHTLSQQFTTDTTFIDLNQGDSITINGNIQQITDTRNSRTVLKIDDKKKYYFFTIDQNYCTKKPIAEEILPSFHYNTSLPISYKINIDTIIVESMKKWYSKGTILYTKLFVEYNDNSTKYNPAGVLLHETIYKPKMFGGKKTDPFQETFNIWKQQFANDLNDISAQIDNNQKPLLYNLKDENYLYKTNLLTGVLFHLGINGFLVDGEIIFSKPETDKKFYRHSNILRYRQGDKFKSLEFTMVNENINLRLNPKFQAQFRSGLFLGINNWDNLKQEDHPIYDLLILDFSASQLFMYNHFDTNSIIAGIGITECAYYIYTQNIKFEPYVTCYLGIKF
ncbi:hypothetical protein ACFLTE_00455 [Bacteroidota bacterium]